MVTHDYMVRCALRHSHRSVGYAFCKALGILHLVGKNQGNVVYKDTRYTGIKECFANKQNPIDIRFRQEV